MQRAGKIVIVCHCLLNANAKVRPLAAYPGVNSEVMSEFIQNGFGILQLPCPETCVLGMSRWGMTREQYDTPFYRRSCRDILRPSVDQMEAFQRAGYLLHGVIGMDGSPNCGVSMTCEGFCGGEVSAPESDVPGQIENLRMVSGTGVMMEELRGMLCDRSLAVDFYAVDEAAPDGPLVPAQQD